MAFLAEDGTGLEESNSLTTVAFASEYFTDRAVASWGEATSAAQQAALIKATDYFEYRFGGRLYSQREVEGQALSFPRVAWPGIVPKPIQKGIAEYANRALSASLAPDPTVDASGRIVKRSRRKLGPLETEVEFAEGSAVKLFKPYPAADALFAPYLLPTNRVIR